MKKLSYCLFVSCSMVLPLCATKLEELLAKKDVVILVFNVDPRGDDGIPTIQRKAQAISIITDDEKEKTNSGNFFYDETHFEHPPAVGVVILDDEISKRSDLVNFVVKKKLIEEAWGFINEHWKRINKHLKREHL